MTVRKSMKVFGSTMVGAGVIGSLGASLPTSVPSGVRDASVNAGMTGMNLMAIGEVGSIGMEMTKKLKDLKL